MQRDLISDPCKRFCGVTSCASTSQGSFRQEGLEGLNTLSLVFVPTC